VSDFIVRLKLEAEVNKQRETNEVKIDLSTICRQLKLPYLDVKLDIIR